MRLTVAITGVGGGVGQGIIKALRMSSLDCRFVAADANPLSAGLYRADVAYVLPPADEPSYGRQVMEMLRREGAVALFPGSDPELPVLASLKPVIEAETGARVIISSPEVVDVANDKWLTVQFLARHGLPHAASVLPERADELEAFLLENPFPLVLKPRKGSASRGVYQVRNRAHLQALLPEVRQPVLQELLGRADAEYTCGLFVDEDGQVLSTITARRELLGGTTYRAWVADFPEVREMVEMIGAALRPLGSCNVQLRLTERGPVPFEINPRCSGTTPIRAYFGWNGPEAAVRKFVLGEEVQLSFRPGLALRYWNEVFLDPSLANELAHTGRLENPSSDLMSTF